MTQQTYPTPPPGPQYGPPPAYGPPPVPQGRPRRGRTGIVVASIVAGLVVLGGLVVGAVLLFGAKTLDTADVEAEISRVTAEETGVAPEDVSCPTDVEAESGGTFSCTASLEDQPVSFTVRQTDDEGNVQIDGDNEFVYVDVVEASLDEQVGALAGVAVISTCDTDGRSVLVDAVGTPITCFVDNAADATDTVEVVATVDESGEVTYEFA
ncbi:UNVERIFIED_ORG: DUF4333 domain-containing protein [Bacillus sp. AZ43]